MKAANTRKTTTAARARKAALPRGLGIVKAFATAGAAAASKE